MNTTQIVVSILFLFFSPVLFSYSVHLFRQILAGTILFYILVECFFYGKIKYWLIFMLPLIHSTTFLFIPMMFLFRFMNPYMNKKSIIIMLLFVVILSNYQSIASLLLTFISGKIVFLDYILSRASEDTRYELGKLPIHQIGILLFIVVAIIVLNLKRVKYNDGLYKFYNVFVFLSVFIKCTPSFTITSGIPLPLVSQTLPFIIMLKLCAVAVVSTVLVSNKVNIIVFTLFIFVFCNYYKAKVI